MLEHHTRKIINKARNTAVDPRRFAIPTNGSWVVFILSSKATIAELIISTINNIIKLAISETQCIIECEIRKPKGNKIVHRNNSYLNADSYLYAASNPFNEHTVALLMCLVPVPFSIDCIICKSLFIILEIVEDYSLLNF